MAIDFNLYNKPLLLTKSKAELVKRTRQMMCQQQKDMSSAKIFSEDKLSIGKNQKIYKAFRSKFFIDLRNNRCYGDRSII